MILSQTEIIVPAAVTTCTAVLHAYHAGQEYQGKAVAALPESEDEAPRRLRITVEIVEE